jgi:hypothetical protein
MRTGNLLLICSRNGLTGCKSFFSTILTVVVHGIGQVPVGVLPAGQPAAMHAVKYPESSV